MGRGTSTRQPSSLRRTVLTSPAIMANGVVEKGKRRLLVEADSNRKARPRGQVVDPESNADVRLHSTF
jgi:hypothetical protein